jgi:hypothetical protein
MRAKCEEIEQEIQKFRRFIESEQPLDPLTVERLKAAVEEMKTTKAALHPEQE